jgi:hypothetical protein
MLHTIGFCGRKKKIVKEVVIVEEEEKGSERPITCKMNRLLFDDKCYPFVTIALTKRAANDHSTGKQEGNQKRFSGQWKKSRLSRQSSEGSNTDPGLERFTCLGINLQRSRPFNSIASSYRTAD